MRVPITRYLLLPIISIVLIVAGVQGEITLGNNVMMLIVGIILLIATILCYYRLYAVAVKKSTLDKSNENTLIFIAIILAVIAYFVG